MSRYIDVEPMRDDWLHEANESIFCPNDVLDSIDSQPDADVEPVRHAHWVTGEHGGYVEGNPLYGIYVCSNCKNEICEEITPDYCPHCGAKMELFYKESAPLVEELITEENEPVLEISQVEE